MLHEKKNKIGLIMALPSESQGIFEKNLVADLHFCGIGKVNAAMKTAEMILKHGYTNIWNLGTAGSHKFNTHTLVECSAFVQRDMDLSPLGFPRGQTPLEKVPAALVAKIITKLPHGVCGTGDSFEVGPPKLECDLVDMEAFAIAKVCYQWKVPLTALKYVTDGSDPDSHSDWSANLPKAALALYEAYLELCR